MTTVNQPNGGHSGSLFSFSSLASRRSLRVQYNVTRRIIPADEHDAQYERAPGMQSRPRPMRSPNDLVEKGQSEMPRGAPMPAESKFVGSVWRLASRSWPPETHSCATLFAFSRQ